MEATVLSVGKSVLNGALSYAKSALAEEVALQLGIQRDQAFIRDELEMMQAFLMAAHDERDEHKVVKTWVKQVRDVAYDVEDCLQDFAVRLEKQSWWRIPRTLQDRRCVAKQMKDLRAKVEDVSQRNVRYRLIKDSRSKPTASSGQSSIAGATMFGIEEARRQQDKAKVDLVQLIKQEDKNLKVIAVWGTSGVLGQTSIIKGAYENPEVKGNFECHAWVRVMHPFDPKEFLISMVRQLNTNSLEATGKAQDGATAVVEVLMKMEKMGHADLAHEFSRHVNEKSCLIVLNDLSNIEDWDWIQKYFPNKKNGSRIIVSTERREVASLCVGQVRLVSELKQSSADHTIYAFYEKGSEDGTNSMEAGLISNATTTCSSSSAGVKSLIRRETMAAALKESELVGRVDEKTKLIELISKESQQLEVISVCGMGGLGKTTLVKDVYHGEELNGMFEKRACVTVMRPFNLEDLRMSLAMQLDPNSFGNKEAMGLMGYKTKQGGLMGDKTKTGAPPSLADLLQGKKYLIILDDLSSTTEWDAIKQDFPRMEPKSRIIVTTRVWNIAKHCSGEQNNIYNLKQLVEKDATNLFTKKVFKEIVDLDEQYSELAEEAKPILKKCSGLPLAIVTIGGFLANQPKTVVEWRKLNEHISAELEINPELGTIRTVLDKSYDGLPYHLKSCFLYLSIFPEDHKVSRRRLVRRWTAEGYSREVRDKSAEEIADNYFMELIHRSMILPSQRSIYSRNGIDSCQLHDLIREISISRSMEENLVFRLEKGCSLNSQGIIRHLAISSSWEGDQSELESIVDMSRIRSLTVFGKWRPFLISDKMRLLRVLDLEGTSGLVDHHLVHIGKLLHLTYLSIRGCEDIFHLPDSVGNLRRLQTLDVAGTRLVKLPKTIIKLRKLQYIRGGSVGNHDAVFFEEVAEGLPKVLRNKLCVLTLFLVVYCVACCAPQLLKRDFVVDGDFNRRDVCTASCCAFFPHVAMAQTPRGVAVPRGIRKLKALHTLGIVNIARGKAVIQDIRRFTQLRKLGVTGVNKKNGQELCSAIAALSRLESLLVRSEGEPGLSGCLDGMPSPPKNLQSLKLYGNLVKLPEWIQGLQNLVKLKLRSTRISELDAAIQVLGKLPNLAILRLWQKSFQGEELRFNFRQEAFPSLMVLELDRLHNLKSVEFEEGATPKLELLDFCGWRQQTKIGLFSGLPSLPSLKEFLLVGGYEDDFVEDLRAQLAKNRKRPALKMM